MLNLKEKWGFMSQRDKVFSVSLVIVGVSLLVLVLVFFLQRGKWIGREKIGAEVGKEGAFELADQQRDQIFKDARKTLNPNVCNHLGDEKSRKGCQEETERSMANLKKVNLVYAGTLYLDAGNYDEAIKVYEEAVRKKDPLMDERGYLSLADAYAQKALAQHLENELLPLAFAAVEEAKKINPNSLQIFLSEGYLNEVGMKPDKAVESYSKALKMSPDYVPAYVRRAHAYNMWGILDKALEDYRRAAKLDVKMENMEIYAQLCRLESTRSDLLSDAMKNCKIVIDGEKSSVNQRVLAYQIIAGMLVDSGDYDQALKMLSESLAYSPEDVNSLVVFALIQNSKKDYFKAEEYAKKAIQIDGKKAVAFGELAKAFAGQGDFNQAIDNFLKALSLIEEDPSLLLSVKEVQKKEYYAFLADAYSALGNEEKYREYLKKSNN